MNSAKEEHSKSNRKEELMGTKQPSQVHVPSSPPLREEEKKRSLSSSESGLKNSKRGSGSEQPKILEHKQVTMTTYTSVTSLGIPPHLVCKKECLVSPKSERLKKTRSGSKPGCGTHTHERGESDEMEGEFKSKSKSDTATSCDSEKDSATHRSSPRSKGPTLLKTAHSPGFSISGSSRSKSPSSSRQLHQSTSSIPPSSASAVLLSPTVVSHSACATKKNESLSLPQKSFEGASSVEAEKNGCELDKSSSSPGESLYGGQCHTTKSSLPSTIGVTPPPHSTRDGGGSFSDKVGSGKGDAKVPMLQQQYSSSSTHVVTTSGDNNNNSDGVMTGVPDVVGSKGSQETIVGRGGSKKLQITGDMVSHTNTSQSAVGRTRKIVSVPHHSKEQHSDVKRSMDDTNDPTNMPPNKRRRASTNFSECHVYSGRDGTPTGSAPQSAASRDPAFVLAKKTMSAAEKKCPNTKHNLKGKGTGEGLQIVKKTPGIQNATRKVLESLRSRGPMLFSDISNILPKLSKAKANMLLDVVRVAGLVREVKGQGSSPPRYLFLGESPASDYINLGSISSDTRARLAEIRSTNSRIAAIREILARSPDELDHGKVSELVRVLSKSDKSMDEDPLYTLIRNFAP